MFAPVSTRTNKIWITKENSGVVCHGLISEYAENMALLRGLMPTTMGLSRKKMEKEEREDITQKVSHALGHNDLHTIGAYFGSFVKGEIKVKEDVIDKRLISSDFLIRMES